MEVDGEDHIEAQQIADEDVVDGAIAPVAVGGSDLHLDQHVLPVPHSQVEKVTKSGMCTCMSVSDVSYLNLTHCGCHSCGSLDETLLSGVQHLSAQK